ncbi:MAG: hypothetical protein ACRDB0_00440, partial [Paraclostridium sp.]
MFTDDLKDLLSIKKPILWVKTFEEKESLIAIKNAIDSTEECDNIFTWSSTTGVQKMVMNGNRIEYEQIVGIGIDRLLQHMNNNEKEEDLETSSYILKDFHLITSNPSAIRGIRDIAESKRAKYNPIIIVSPSSDIPYEWEKLTSIIEYKDPTQKEILDLITTYERMSSTVIDNKLRLSNLFVGFSRKEVIDTISMSILKNGEINESEIANKKIEIIKRTGVLDYREPKITFDQIGGNTFFKNWVKELEF